MSKKLTLDDVISLDISYLKKVGCLSPNSSIELFWLRNTLIVDRVKLFIEYDFLEMAGGRVYFTRTPCNFGGDRLWFVCPECERRSRVLYSLDFICRQCVALVHGSVGMGKLERLDRKIDKFKKMKCIDDNFFIKPKQVHRITHMKNMSRCISYMENRVNLIFNVL